MKCPSPSDWDLLASDALAEDEIARLRAHALTCEACQAQLAAARRLHIERVRMYEAFDHRHDELREQLMAALPLERPRPRAAGGLVRLGEILMSLNTRTTRRTLALLAPAACIVMALILFTPGGERSAFAAAISRLRQAQTITCRFQAFINDSDLPMQSGTLQMSNEHGARFDAEMNMGALPAPPAPGGTAPAGVFAMSVFQKEGSPVTIIQPPLKVAMKMHVPPGFSGFDGNFNQSSPDMFVQQFRQLTAGAETALGRTTIDGVECEGYEIPGRKLGLAAVSGAVKAAGLDEGRARLWVDIREQLPVRMEVELNTEMPGLGTLMRIRCIYDRFVIDQNLPAELFVPQIPDDYRVVEATVPPPTEETLLAALRLFRDTTGRYPTALDPARLSGELMATLISSGKVKFDPADPAAAMSGEVLEAAITAAIGAAFVVRLNAEQRGIEYFGDIVGVDEPEKVLLRWNQADGTLRVIYADLRAETRSTGP